MKFTIVATVLGLLLTPAFAQYLQNVKTIRNPLYRRISIGSSFQTLSVDNEKLVAIIESRRSRGAWKTIWNYDTGFIASRVGSERACYIARMNRFLMPSFTSVAVLAEDAKQVTGERLASKEVRYIISDRLIHDLKSYGPEIYDLCKGFSSYIAYEQQQQQREQQWEQQQQQQQQQQGSQVWYRDSCYRLDVLNLLGIYYCRAGSI